MNTSQQSHPQLVFGGRVAREQNTSGVWFNLLETDFIHSLNISVLPVGAGFCLTTDETDQSRILPDISE